jgi:acyl phosphate:glycerol-3-phosphate acyltransferase
MLELALKTLFAYWLGSLMGALLLGAVRGVDIRRLGSGNAGGTNALRTQGTWFALGVVLIDISKGWLAAAWLPHWQSALFSSAEPIVSQDELTYACAVAATLGHVYPVWWEFRGGKGAATLIGIVLGAAPIALAPMLTVFVLTLVLTGYVGLSTMLTMGTLPIVLVLRGDASTAALTFAVLMSIFVVYTHRANIQRMWAGDENRARRVWIGTYVRGRSA